MAFGHFGAAQCSSHSPSQLTTQTFDHFTFKRSDRGPPKARAPVTLPALFGGEAQQKRRLMVSAELGRAHGIIEEPSSEIGGEALCPKDQKPTYSEYILLNSGILLSSKNPTFNVNWRMAQARLRDKTHQHANLHSSMGLMVSTLGNNIGNIRQNDARMVILRV